MAEELLETDVVVRSAHPGTPGDWGYGPATPYNFYIEGDDRKFSWFHSENKPIVPEKGMQIKLMEYKEVPKGEYLNYNVSRIILHGDAHKKAIDHKDSVTMPKRVAQPNNNAGRDNTLTMYISYAKDIAVAEIAQGKFKETTTREIGILVADIGKEMYDNANEIDIWSHNETKEVEKKFLDDEYEGIIEDEPPPHTDGDYFDKEIQ